MARSRWLTSILNYKNIQENNYEIQVFGCQITFLKIFILIPGLWHRDWRLTGGYLKKQSLPAKNLTPTTFISFC